MRAALGEAVRATVDRGVLLLGLLAAVLTLAVALGTGLLVSAATVSPIDRLLLAVAGFPVVMAAAVPALVGIYVRTGRARADVSVWSNWSALGVALVVWIAVSLSLGVAVALALGAVGLSALTAVQFAAYGLGVGSPLDPTLVLFLGGVLLGLGLTLGVLATRFFDCLCLATGVGPVGALRESLRFVRTDPRSFAGYAVVVWLLGALTGGVTVLLTAPLSGLPELAVVIALLGLYLGFVGTFHATVFERRVLPAVCADGTRESSSAESSSDECADAESARTGRDVVRDRPLVANPTRLALVVMVLVGLLVGSATIRALDVRPVDEHVDRGPVDARMAPDEILTGQSVPTSSTSVHAVQRATALNESTGEWRRVMTVEYEHDYADRRVVVSGVVRDRSGEVATDVTQYASPSLFALRYESAAAEGGPQRPPPERAWAQRVAGDWIVYSAGGYSLFDSEPTVVSEVFLDQEWTVADETDDAVVLTAEGSDVTPLEGNGASLADETVIEVAVDRETGLVEQIHQEIHVDDENATARRLTVEFEGWGSHDVDRPAEFGPGRPIEWAWAVAYY